MPDMLVKLYNLPEYDASGLERDGYKIRVANPWEKSLLLDWVAENFSSAWAAELSQSFATLPATNLIATKAGKIVAFACFDCTRKGFFGPTGVAESERKKGIGKALLIKTLLRMYDYGYAYAIIGGAGPSRFYKDAVGAVEIEGSVPGIYVDNLKE